MADERPYFVSVAPLTSDDVARALAELETICLLKRIGGEPCRLPRGHEGQHDWETGTP